VLFCHGDNDIRVCFVLSPSAFDLAHPAVYAAPDAAGSVLAALLGQSQRPAMISTMAASSPFDPPFPKSAGVGLANGTE
jgi:hypothetical protein